MTKITIPMNFLQARKYDAFSRQLEELLKEQKIPQCRQPILEALFVEEQAHGQPLLVEVCSFSQSGLSVLEAFLPGFSNREILWANFQGRISFPSDQSVVVLSREKKKAKYSLLIVHP
jgi:hypothetical protein